MRFVIWFVRVDLIHTLQDGMLAGDKWRVNDTTVRLNLHGFVKAHVNEIGRKQILYYEFVPFLLDG